MVNPQILLKGLKLITTLPGDDVYIMGDAHRLSLILSNFLSNAIKFTADGHIAVSIQVKKLHEEQRHQGEKEEGEDEKKTQRGSKEMQEETEETEDVENKAQLVIQVEDTGIGMDAEEQKKLFIPFSQSNSRFGGSGLGLTICKVCCHVFLSRMETESLFPEINNLDARDNRSCESERQRNLDHCSCSDFHHPTRGT